MPKGYSNKDGKPLINPQARKGKVPWNKDKKLPPLSKKWKDNIGKANKGHLVSKGKRIKIGNKHRGKIISIELRNKIKRGMKGKHNSPSTEFKKGEHKGENHWLWKGGQKPYKHPNSSEYKQWRSQVFKRDNYICQFCEATKIYVVPHHIKGWTNYPKLRYKINNGITLCRPCHKLTIRKEAQFEEICLFKLLAKD